MRFWRASIAIDYELKVISYKLGEVRNADRMNQRRVRVWHSNQHGMRVWHSVGLSTPQNLASKVRVGSFKDPRQWVAEKGVLLYKGDNTFFALEHGIVEPHGTDTVLDT